MKITTKIPGLITLLMCLFIFIECQSPESGALTEADKAYITNFYKNAVEGWNKGDREPYLARLAPDVNYMPSNNKIKAGYDAVKEYVYSYPEVVAEINPVEIIGDNKLAVVRGVFTIRSKEGQLLDEGKFLNVIEKNSEGKWLTTYDIFNSDLPLPEPPAEEPEETSGN
jgi:ketosteroid isomerase-like protein